MARIGWKRNRVVMAKKILLSPYTISFVPTIITIVIGLLCGLVMLLFTAGEQALPAFKMILTGGFSISGASNGIGRVIFYSIPIMMTGLSVGLAFKADVFNMGATGQFTMGVYAGVYAGIMWQPIFGPATWVAALFLGAAAGGLWGLLQGLLQAYRNVNAIVCGIMMNYVAMFVANILVLGNKELYFGGRNWTNSIPHEGLLPTAGLNKIFVGAGANSGIIFGIIFCIAIFFILEKTTLGFEMKAVGYNLNAARYAGINFEKNILITMTMVGAVAGLGGMMFTNGAAGQKYSLGDVLRPEGITGIPVALLASNHPIGIIFSAIFIAYLQVGGLAVASFGLEPDLVSVITAIIIFFCSFKVVIRNMYLRLMEKVL